MQPSIKSDSFSGPLNEARAASTAGGGTALTTAAVLVPLPRHTTHVGMIVRNFVTAVVVKFALNPWLFILRSDNLLLSVTGFSVQGQEVGGTGITLSSLATFLNGGVFYIGSHLPFRGTRVDMSAAVNVNASVLLVEYWNGTAWVSLAATDGTAAGGATFAQDGDVTWTVPAAWTKAFAFATLGPGPVPPNLSELSMRQGMTHNEKPRYWTRWTVSAALSASVVANTMFSLNRSTTYAEAVEDSLLQFRMIKGTDSLASLELLTDAGTANAIVNAYVQSSAGAF